MTLPTSRNTTYAAGSPIKSADLNDLQDAIIDGAHGDQYVIVGAAAFQQGGGSGSPTFNGWTWDGDASNSATMFATVPLLEGDRILEMSYYGTDVDASNRLRWTAWRSDIAPDPATSPTNLHSTVDSFADGASGDVTGVSVNQTLTDRQVVVISCLIDANATCALHGVRIKIDRP
jgi:hypothetical protein